MVQNPKDLRSSSDVLAVVQQDRTKPVESKRLTPEQINAMLGAARPFAGHRRDSYFLALHRQWWINSLFYCGIQGLDVPDVLENVDPGLLLENGSYVANMILRLVAGNVARLSSAKAEWSVVPNTPDQQDQDGARVGQKLLDYAWDYLQLQRKRMMVNLWLDVCGSAFLYTGWDRSKGEVRRFYYDPLTSKPIARQQLKPGQDQFLDSLGAYSERSDGDWDVEVIGPFDVFFPVGYVEIDRMPWMLIRRYMSLDEIWDRWPERAGELEEEGAKYKIGAHYGRRLTTLTNRPGSMVIGGGALDDAWTVDELWVPHSKRCPGGFYCMAAGQTILESGPHPLKAAGLDIKYPLVDFHNLRVPNRFHAMSTVEHLIGPQREYNRSRQQIIKQRDILSVPQWLAPIGALSKNAVRNEEGDIWEYNPRVGKPELVQPPALGQAQVVSGQQAQADMQTIASFSDASLGQMPQGARSGNAVMMLTERDNLAIGPVVTDQEKSWERSGTNLLKLSWKFMEIPRAVAIYGEAKQADLRYFRGSDMNGNTRVWVRAGSMTPKSKAQTFELLTNLMQVGTLNPADPREKRLVLETLEVGGIDRLYHLQDAARRRARIENLMFSKPDPDPNFAFPDVTQWDDHQSHFEEHLAFLYTDEYELLDPMIKLMFQAHLNKHIGAIAQMMEAQAALAGAAGAGPGGGSPEAKPLGKPSPPKQNASQSKAEVT